MKVAIGDKYLWTTHSHIKMRQYGLSESRIKRIIRHPARVEEGILEGAVAAMQPSGSKKYSEIWVMYVIVRDRFSSGRLSSAHRADFSSCARPRSPAFGGNRGRSASRGLQKSDSSQSEFSKGIKVITAWRYPGKAPERDPVPQNILREIRKLF